MGRYYVHQNDANFQEIKDGLEAVGASVDGRCPLDLLVGFRGANYLLEVKTAKGKLRASQEAFLGRWKGQSRVVRTLEDALVEIGAKLPEAFRPKVEAR